MNGHTLGPWKAVDLRHQKNGQIRIWTPESHIANVLAYNDNCEANASLITKAPELLKIGRELIEALSRQRCASCKQIIGLPSTTPELPCLCDSSKLLLARAQEMLK